MRLTGEIKLVITNGNEPVTLSTAYNEWLESHNPAYSRRGITNFSLSLMSSQDKIPFIIFVNWSLLMKGLYDAIAMYTCTA